MHSLPEWTDLRFFLELARAGTLSGASRRLDVEHTTVARRIDRLEQQLGTTLFDRSREGYELTEMGLALLPHAEAMEGAALAGLRAYGCDENALRGPVAERELGGDDLSAIRAGTRRYSHGDGAVTPEDDRGLAARLSGVFD